MIDADKAAPRCTRMWWKLGLLLEKAAYAAAERNSHTDIILNLGRAADACFWQATGDMDTICLTDVLPKKKDA